MAMRMHSPLRTGDSRSVCANVNCYTTQVEIDAETETGFSLFFKLQKATAELVRTMLPQFEAATPLAVPSPLPNWFRTVLA